MTVAVPGRHNLLNALGAVAIGIELQVPFTRIADALAEFTGAERRFQVRGERAGRDGGRRLRPSPHRDRRGDRRRPCRRPPAARGLSAAPVYQDARSDAGVRAAPSAPPTRWCSPTSTPAGEPPIESVTVDALADRGPRRQHLPAPRRPSSSRTFRRRSSRLARPGDLVITLGAGSIGAVGDRILARRLDGDAQGRGAMTVKAPVGTELPPRFGERRQAEAHSARACPGR